VQHGRGEDENFCRKGISEIGTLMGKLFKSHKLKCNAFITE
jgi:hypothetical protein